MKKKKKLKKRQEDEKGKLLRKNESGSQNEQYTLSEDLEFQTLEEKGM